MGELSPLGEAQSAHTERGEGCQEDACPVDRVSLGISFLKHVFKFSRFESTFPAGATILFLVLSYIEVVILGRRQVITIPWDSVHLSCTCYTTSGSANDIPAIKWTTCNHICGHFCLRAPNYYYVD
jgi:hypothetical protein